MGLRAVGCVPCLMKRLVLCFWGDNHPGTHGGPGPLPYDSPCWSNLQILANRWYYLEPENLEGILDNEENKNKTAAQKVKITQRLKAAEMSAQQDAEGFMSKILDGIENTYTILPIPRLRAQQYASLFTCTTHETHVCQQCNFIRDRSDTNELRHDIGIRIKPLHTPPDDVAAAIDRTQYEPLGIPCENCHHNDEITGIRRVQRILAAPEYLRIHVDFLQYRLDKRGNFETDKEGDILPPVKDHTPIRIPEELDITHLLSFRGPNRLPVRYKLWHIVYHAGQNLSGGHYATAVTGVPEQEGAQNQRPYLCNDTAVQPIRAPRSRMRNNPFKMGHHFEPSLLWYVMMEPDRAERKKQGNNEASRKREVEVDESEVDDGKSVAERLKENPRKRVKRVL